MRIYSGMFYNLVKSARVGVGQVSEINLGPQQHLSQVRASERVRVARSLARRGICRLQLFPRRPPEGGISSFASCSRESTLRGIFLILARSLAAVLCCSLTSPASPPWLLLIFHARRQHFARRNFACSWRIWASHSQFHCSPQCSPVQTRPPKFDLPQGLPLLFGENVVHFCGLKITKFKI